MSESNVKYCHDCGHANHADQKFCGECGYSFDKPQEIEPKRTSELEKGSGLGIVSLVTAILGFTCLPGIGLIIAMITGYITPDAKKNTYAKAGTSIAVYVLATGLLVTCIVMFFGGSWVWFMWALLSIGVIVSITAIVLHTRWILKKPAT